MLKDRSFVVWLLLLEVVVISLSAVTSYGSDLNVTNGGSAASSVQNYYAFFQDVHIMIFVGFGFLMTFLRSYSFGAVALNFIIGSFALQMGMLATGVVHNGGGFDLDITSLIAGDFAAGAVLISLGAVLGIATPTQALLMCVIEVWVFSLNEYICVTHYESVDMGGSIVVHTFGAIFGLFFTWALVRGTENARGSPSGLASNYSTIVVAMIGTLFLWCFWPSFNGALAIGNAQHRVVINTVLGLCASCTAAFCLSAILRGDGKVDAEDILNATLAGGVAIGSSSDLVVSSTASLCVGFIGGALSTVSFRYITPWLKKRGFHDTCGVFSLHGLPGVMGGFGGAISAATVDDAAFGDAIGTIFPAMGNGRSAYEQMEMQFAAVFTTIGIAAVCGVVGGFLVRWITSANQLVFQDEGFMHEGKVEPADSEEESNMGAPAAAASASPVATGLAGRSVV